ncbi:hypothetical protein ACS0TY_001020 [Phlomoides rotata]
MKILNLWLHIVICLMQYQTGFPSYLVNNTAKNHLCHQEESQLLFQLKQLVPPPEKFQVHEMCSEIPTNYSKPMYWKQRRDCCLWDGVTCDDSTGHVIGLDLSCSGLTGNIHSNSTLFRLTHLRKLNLGYNHLQGSEITFKFGHLSSLSHLNLSRSGFGGHIPVEFYHLSNLVSLDITSNLYSTAEVRDDLEPILYCDIKALFGNMTKLRVVLLGGVNISSQLPLNMSSFLTHLDLGDTGVGGNLPESIFEKPSLQVLILQDNDGLAGSLPSFNRSNVRLIEQLVLRETSISGRLPHSIGFMTNLNILDLAWCKFSGPIPDSIANLTQITKISLSSNELSGEFPSTIANLRQLTYLYLTENNLQGQLPVALSDLQKLTQLYLDHNDIIGIMPSSLANMSQLQVLDISYNALTGRIPSTVTNMSQLLWMDVSSNKLTGPFPSTAGDGLQKLTHMVLSHNSIQGMVPSWLLTLPSLQRLDLSSNKLTGEIENFNSESLSDIDLSNNLLNIELHSFSNLTQIGSLRLSHNTVTEQGLKVVNVSLPNLHELELSSCGIKEFPDLLRNLSLSTLDLSNNKIHGPIPSWFNFQLAILNLSNNHLTHLPYLPQQQIEYFLYLDLHSNSLQDTIPLFICNMSQLAILDLSNNKLRGSIPECIGTFSYALEVLDLRRNKLHGKIPTTIGGTNYALSNLVLNGNHLEGALPRSLASCTQLEVLDVGNNKIQDTFPSWLQNLTGLKVLILKSNCFHGSISPPLSNINSFSSLQIIDVSHNNFTGILPEKLFARLQGMKKQDEAATFAIYLGSDLYQYSMTLSVKGADREFTRVLSTFTTIDLSSNNFEGTIPESITHLTVLRLLNLSYNSFSGTIPPALGLMMNLEELDLSSNQLRGGIPQALTNLTFLAILNLSFNHLVGPIPKGNQFQTFSNESYVGNSGLCGYPLTRSCGGEHPSPGVSEEEDEDYGFMMGFTWKTVVIGYGCGIVLGFILGNVMISAKKPKWVARFVYTEAAIILKRRKKKAARKVLLGK